MYSLYVENICFLQFAQYTFCLFVLRMMKVAELEKEHELDERARTKANFTTYGYKVFIVLSVTWLVVVIMLLFRFGVFLTNLFSDSMIPSKPSKTFSAINTTRQYELGTIWLRSIHATDDTGDQDCYDSRSLLSICLRFSTMKPLIYYYCK